MTVLKIQTKDGRVFYCVQGTRIKVEHATRVSQIETIEMTKAELDDIPATNESGTFFE